MASGMAQTGANKMLDTLTGKSAYSLPSLYIALCTSTTSAASAGTEITVGQYQTYARQALTGSSWSGGSAGSTTYNALLDFGTAGGSSTGTTVTGFELWDASSGGVRLWYEQLATSVPVASGGGTHITFASGQIVATLSLVSGGVGFATTYINKFLDHMTGKTTFGSAPTIYGALTTANSTATTLGTEAAYTSYTRTAQLTSSAFNSASGGAVTFASKVDWPAATGSSSTVIGYGFCDASSAGNLIGAGTITSVVISSPLVPEIAASTTVLQIS